MLFFALLFNICWLRQSIYVMLLLSRLRSRRTGLAPFDWKCSNPYMWFVRLLAAWEHTFTQKVTPSQRETRVMIIGKICKADFLKNLELSSHFITFKFINLLMLFHLVWIIQITLNYFLLAIPGIDWLDCHSR